MPCRAPLVLTSVVAVAAFALLAAGCGGGGSPAAVASVVSSTTAVASSSGISAGTTQSGTLAFARCMRSHGLPGFPDPDSSGGIPKPQVIAARNNNPSRFDAAQNECKHLLPPGGSLSGRSSPAVTPADRTDYLRAAACMRSHGFPGFPDPTFPDNSVRTNIPSSIDQNSSRFRSAAEVCTKLIPAGLPYSSAGGS